MSHDPHDATGGLDFESLKRKQRDLRDGFAPELGLRVHRALSWLKRAEASEDDKDIQFISLWIGFNAAYAGDVDLALNEHGTENGKVLNERERFNTFFAELLAMDHNNRIYDLIWERFSQEIRLLLDNKYVFAPFWRHHAGVPGGAGWELTFEKAKRAAQQALINKSTAVVLSILFDRLYVLRNQLIHGGATWDSSTNRDQLRDGAALLASLLPVFINLMMDNPQEEWAKPYYPVVD